MRPLLLRIAEHLVCTTGSPYLLVSTRKHDNPLHLIRQGAEQTLCGATVPRDHATNVAPLTHVCRECLAAVPASDMLAPPREEGADE